MDFEKLDELVKMVCQMTEEYRIQNRLSYAKLISKWGLVEDSESPVDARQLQRFLQGENNVGFLAKLLLFVQCAEHLGIELEFCLLRDEAIARDKIRRIEVIIKE